MRTEKGFTQESFADYLKLNRVYMGVVERGEASFTLKTLQRLSAGLEIPLWELIREAESGGGE